MGIQDLINIATEFFDREVYFYEDEKGRRDYDTCRISTFLEGHFDVCIHPSYSGGTYFSVTIHTHWDEYKSKEKTLLLKDAMLSAFSALLKEWSKHDSENKIGWAKNIRKVAKEIKVTIAALKKLK